MFAEDNDYLRDRFTDANVEILTATCNETEIDVDSIEELFEYPWIEVVGRVR